MSRKDRGQGVFLFTQNHPRSNSPQSRIEPLQEHAISIAVLTSLVHASEVLFDSSERFSARFLAVFLGLNRAFCSSIAPAFRNVDRNRSLPCNELSALESMDDLEADWSSFRGPILVAINTS